MPDMPGHISPSASHAEHDALLISRFTFDEELEPQERRVAEVLLTTCPDCTALAADLRSIARAVAAEPAPTRPRDFRLRAADAERLRGSPWQRFMGRLALPGTGGLRPLAGSVMALGLLLVAVGTTYPMQGTVPMAPVVQPETMEAMEAMVAAPEAAGEPDAADAAVAADATLMVEAGRIAAEDPALADEPAFVGETGPADIDGRDGTEDALGVDGTSQSLKASDDLTAATDEATDDGSNQQKLVIGLGIVVASAGLVLLILTVAARRREGGSLQP